MQLGLSENLSSLVSRRFTAAKEAGHLIFSSTQLAIIQASGIPYQLRYCPSLAKKPIPASSSTSTEPGTAAEISDIDGKDQEQEQEKQKPSKPDPFTNPSEELLIAQIPASNPTHTLVLNKYPVIRNHFILATKEWRSQDHLLEKEDLSAAYACLKAWEDGNDQSQSQSRPKKRLFSFYNSGKESGASQPHRHLQFLPVEDMRVGGDVSGFWEPLIDGVPCSSSSTMTTTSTPSKTDFKYIPHIPFAHFALPLPPNPSAETLHSIYLSLYKAAVAVTKSVSSSTDQEENYDTTTIATEGPIAIGYNLAMTVSTMLICPRKSDRAVIPVAREVEGQGAETGVVSVNGTVLAGTLMVKAESEWDLLREDPQVLTDVLVTVGYPRQWSSL
ncbi:bifunctional AP-4-A phosphorylase/ADP sulfurylase [Monascus purpureus]|uniref:Bifunctional AP-4-A phosphorylase/ADP sulfurylase n=1 Tax=Monascus purpureus TaxID=5098 RepID=A0A507QM65_MONPU|nr:bifunctional AP-4-A phosphorylase/ADP sulfurylase [Monascus purpureus]BDD57711.1 hypothetical protein MAP00_003056 [Monascus purpureus]